LELLAVCGARAARKGKKHGSHLAADEVFNQRPHDARWRFAGEGIDDAASAAVAVAGRAENERRRLGEARGA